MGDVSASAALEMLTEVSGIPDIDPEKEFDFLRLDSLQLLEWLSTLEDEADADLKIQTLDFNDFSGRRIGDVVDLLCRRAAEATPG